MKKIALLTLILFMMNPVFAEEKNIQERVPVFTEQDLEKYRGLDTDKPAERPLQTDDTAHENSFSSFADSEKQKTKRYEIPYKAYEGTARRVIINVKLNGSVTAPMALDTGSPGMIISDRLANRLGLFEKDDGRLMTFAAGIGGTVPATLTIIDTVQVDKAEDHFIPTIITQSISGAFEGLIGMDFMANYSVKIDTRKHVVILEELPKKPDMPAGHDEIWWRGNFRIFAMMRSEWKKYRESLDTQKGDAKKIQELKKFADRQYKEADKLFNKLNGYAIRNSVPMHWREF